MLSLSLLCFFPPLRRGNWEFPFLSLPWPDLPSHSLLCPLMPCPWMLEAQGSTRACTVLAAVGMVVIRSLWCRWEWQRRHFLCREIAKEKAPSIPTFFRGSSQYRIGENRKRLKRFIWRHIPCILYFKEKVFLYWDYLFHMQLFC